jgi:hypothetical protein
LKQKHYFLPFTFLPDVREKKNLFSDAWAIAEAYVGFCVGFTYLPSPIRRTLLYITSSLFFQIMFSYLGDDCPMFSIPSLHLSAAIRSV